MTEETILKAFDEKFDPNISIVSYPPHGDLKAFFLSLLQAKEKEVREEERKRISEEVEKELFSEKQEGDFSFTPINPPIVHNTALKIALSIINKK